MTTETHSSVVLGGLLASRYVVRIMTGGAQETRLAFLETGRLAQPVRRVCDLEPVVIRRSRTLIEVQNVINQWLTGPVGEDAARVTNDGRGQAETRDFQMALHAQIQLPLAAQPGRVYDCALGCLSRLHRLNVIAPRSVAALAIDTAREGSTKNRGRSHGIGTLFNLRITVVTEHTLI